MKSTRDSEVLVKAFLEGGINELPDRSYDVVRASIEETRQRVVFGPWREDQMTAFAKFAIAAAAVVLIAVIGIRFLPTDSSVGLQPTPTPTTAPTGSPAPTPTPEGAPVGDPGGRLQPGTYTAHPFTNDTTSFTFNIESSHWESQSEPGQMFGISWVGESGTEPSGGVGMGFLLVNSLNADACHWSGTADDVALGPSGDDLLRALQEPTTNFEVTDGPMTASTANFSGQELVLTMPADLSTAGCDEESYRIWNAEGFDIYAQGPANVWTVGSFSINPNSADRVVILQSAMPDTPDTVLSELRQVVSSVRIEPGEAQVTPTPTPATTPRASVVPRPVAADPDNGPLSAGVYVAHPFVAPNDGIAFMLTVPSDAWEAHHFLLSDGGMYGLSRSGDSTGVGLFFERVRSLESDPCNNAGKANDVQIGPTVDDLVAGLAAQTAYTSSAPIDVTLGGYSGKQIVLTMPDDLRPGGDRYYPGCDDQVFAIWNAEGITGAARGPSSLWTLWILDIDGERVVVRRSEYADTPVEWRQQLDSIVDSLVITSA